MSSKLSPRARIAAVLASLAMLAVLVLPIWRIELSAPQYPEGLVLQIFSTHIGGDVDVVNGLNHYIGMHTLHTRDFVEFIALPYIIGGFAVLGILVSVINRKKAFLAWIALFLLIAFTSMIDFYRWEYNYGHNLDPNAPIQVPGMAYQPPLIGFKQLLNFGAYSIPDIGGWLFALVGVVLVTLAIPEIRRKRFPQPDPRPEPNSANPKRSAGPSLNILLLLAATGAFSSCHQGPVPMRIGQDHCEFCMMTVSDARFGAEITTKKGRIFKFDDIHCLRETLRENHPAKTEISAIYLVNFENGSWLKAEEASLLESENFRTPMGGNIAAFTDSLHRQHYLRQNDGRPTTWKDIYQ
jgi:copper chaperone NosL